jgi:hypothetical protein
MRKHICYLINELSVFNYFFISPIFDFKKSYFSKNFLPNDFQSAVVTHNILDFTSVKYLERLQALKCCFINVIFIINCYKCSDKSCKDFDIISNSNSF